MRSNCKARRPATRGLGAVWLQTRPPLATLLCFVVNLSVNTPSSLAEGTIPDLFQCRSRPSPSFVSGTAGQPGGNALSLHAGGGGGWGKVWPDAPDLQSGRSTGGLHRRTGRRPPGRRPPIGTGTGRPAYAKLRGNQSGACPLTAQPGFRASSRRRHDLGDPVPGRLSGFSKEAKTWL